MPKKIRVIVADDSAYMRKKISEILGSDPDIEVIATAKNGKDAVKAVHDFHPDVVTLDVEMPVLNGLDALGYIMSEVPTPCIMISAFTREKSKESIKALELGAIDFITKPDGVISRKIENIKDEILLKVKLAAGVSVSKLKLHWAEKYSEPKARVIKKPEKIKKVVAIASSTGGTYALATILPNLAANIEAAILIVQHMPVGFTASLAERLNWQSGIQVVEAEEGMVVEPGKAIIARGGKHMVVVDSKKGPVIHLTDDLPKLGVKPCADVMMKSVAEIFKDKVIGVVLTGMGSDGTLGAAAIKNAGGTIIAESEDSCIVYGMPKSVVEAGYADEVVNLGDAASKIESEVLK